MKMKKHTKNKRSSAPLKLKLFGAFAAFAAAILALLWALQLWHLDDFYLAITRQNLIEAGASLASANADELQDSADSIALSNEICVLIFDNSGKKLASSNTSGGCLIHKLGNDNLNELYADALSAGGYIITPIKLSRLPGGSVSIPDANQIPIDPTFPDENAAPQYELPKAFDLSRLIYSAVVQTDGGIRFILLDCPLTPVGAVSSTLIVQLTVVSVIAAFAALIAAFILSKRISKPITGLSRGAGMLASGNYETSFTGGGCREIDELSDALTFAASELSKVDRMQKELIANVSHDLRTPLTMITGYAEVMRDIPGENTPENVQVILDETARLSALVNDIIDLSRLQNGRRELDLQPTSLSDAITSTAERFKKLNECNGYTIICRAEENVFVHADRSAIVQVLYNLIGNAITYTGDDKTVYVNMRTADGFATVEISDTGKGIDKDELEHIWKRYYRSEENHERGIGGSGIGLSIVKELLEAHRADYGVSSGPAGTTFTFSLPIV